MRVLYLSVSLIPFQVMVTGEKMIEFRKRTAWILSRLINKKTNELKKYDVVRVTHGYGKDKPYFVAKLNDIYFDYALEDSESIKYSNGLQVKIKQGDVRIYLQQIIEVGNIDVIKKDLNVKLGCMVCDTCFFGPEPQMCCSGRECGCMGMPVHPVCCSDKCFDMVHRHGLRKAMEIKTEKVKP